ncbi:ABC transporter ATP-binding protein [Oribacterium sinus]|uniref:ABC transporter ATP-binding protein n=1 Tax=Oribacterium sinus TaxID=237576 RepID=UPI0028E35A4C|nr:ABC transporter ATP-binding protein [Oribacterium sinus]
MQVQKLSKSFIVGDIEIEVLKEISFDLKEGEMMVVLGPSGSGKSTLLNIIGGIETASSGDVIFQGRRLELDNPSAMTLYRKEELAFVFQFYNLLPNLSVLENVQIIAELSKNSLDARELIQKVGLGGREGYFPAKLSGGQQQRVAIARALSKNPNLLLCDEPTGALDSKTGIKILQLLWEFQREYKKTIVIITHNEKIAEIADRILYIRDGKIEKLLENQDKKSPSEVEW